jgi:hypothetical protein
MIEMKGISILYIRKKIMSTVGAEMLEFIQNNITSESIDIIKISLQHIVPLLEGEHLIGYWKFYLGLLSSNFQFD